MFGRNFITSLALVVSIGSVWAQSAGWAASEDWQEASPQGTVHSSEWFGDYYQDPSGWVYREDLGWILPSSDAADDFSFWSPDMKWVWTSAMLWPNVYRFEDGAWLILVEGLGTRSFYNYNTGAFEDGSVINHAPVIDQGNQQVYEVNAGGYLDFMISARDPNSTDALYWTVLSKPSKGRALHTVSDQGMSVRYVAPAGWTGQERLVVQVSDGYESDVIAIDLVVPESTGSEGQPSNN